MVKKLLRVAMALAMVGLMASPALAVMAGTVDFTFNGWYRVRMIAADNIDRLATTPGSIGRDNVRYLDSVFRPKFTGKLDDNVQGLVELDIPVFNHVLGGGGDALGDPGSAVGAQRKRDETSRDTDATDVNTTVYWFQWKVPGVPGPWWVQTGRMNFFNPRGIVGQAPVLRETGIQIFGVPAPGLDLRLEWQKRSENDIADADDDDVYKVRGKWSPVKEVSIEGGVNMQFINRDATTAASFRHYWPYVSLAGNWGPFRTTLDFIYQTGTWDYNKAGLATTSSDVGKSRTNRDQKLSAYALWFSAGVTMGPVSITGHYLYAKGDSNQEDDNQNQFYAIGCQTTDSFPCDARIQGPTDLWFGDKYNDTFIAGSRNIGGNTGGIGGRYARGNGTRTLAIEVDLKPMPGVVFSTALGFISSAEARPDLTLTGSNPFVRDTYIGTEIDFNLAWTVYKGFTLQGGFDYLAAGDYGTLLTKVADISQEPGTSTKTRLVNSNDSAWQAIFKMEWFF